MMKREKMLSVVLTLSILLGCFGGIGEVFAKNTSAGSAAFTSGKDYSKIGMQLSEYTLKKMFGGMEKKNFEKKLGRAVKTVDKYDYERLYFKQGVEIDVVDQDDAFYMLFNYVYLSPKCKLKTPRNIGIGSSKDQVLKAYKQEINPKLTSSSKIVAGTKDTGITFIMRNNKVYYILIATGGYTTDNGGRIR